MPSPTRELRIVYGSITMGSSSSSYFIVAPVRWDKGPDRAVVEADIIVTGSSEANFASNCTDLETQFRTPRNALEVKFGSAVHETFDPSVNSGFNAIPTCRKAGSTEDTGRSRRYRIAVVVELPADTYTNQSDSSTTSGRRNASIVYSETDAKRRRLAVTGTYTALVSNGARAQYNASITAYMTAVLATFSPAGTWEGPFDPQVSTDDQDKICNFSFIYEELIFNQSQGVLDNTTLRRQRMSVTKSTDSPGDSVVFGIKPQRLQRTTIDYSVAVDKTVTQDLKTIWTGTIRPYLGFLATQYADGNAGFIESEIPSFDPVENRISARMTYVSVPGGNLLSARITTDESESTGISLVPCWTEDRMSKFKFNGPGTITRTVTVVTREVGLPGSTSLVGPGGSLDVIGGQINPPGVNRNDDLAAIGQDDNEGLANAGGVREPQESPDGGLLQRVFLGAVHSATPLRIGQLTGTPLDVVDRVVVARYEYFVDPDDL